ncbi:redoxin domain-containing protein [Mycoplasma buteonis]|uniref:redoxin domain-containing protein n=1 Tax=Mycoplasma buteonis TaxID=171280 RepID=UPI00056D96BC|nr:redoxin domain-containing protein [Mycoplasma buteonis]
MKVKFAARDLNLLGNEKNVGDTVTLTSAVAPGTFFAEELKLKHDYTVLTTYPSVDTRVCELQVLSMGDLSKDFPKINFLAFSVDLPSALAAYKDSHEVGNVKLYSDYQKLALAKELGVLIEEINLCARSVFVVDKDGKIIYKEIKTNTSDNITFNKLKDFLSHL